MDSAQSWLARPDAGNPRQLFGGYTRWQYTGGYVTGVNADGSLKVGTCDNT